MTKDAAPRSMPAIPPQTNRPVQMGTGGTAGTQSREADAFTLSRPGNVGVAPDPLPMPEAVENWTCARCGQLNAGWASECGRCEFVHAAPTPSAPANIAPEAVAELCNDLRCLYLHSATSWLDLVKERAAAMLSELSRALAERDAEVARLTKWHLAAVRSAMPGVIGDDPELWEGRQAGAIVELFHRAERAEAEIESLRAECGLRQILGYNEGKAHAEAEAATLRKDAERYRGLRAECVFAGENETPAALIEHLWVDAAITTDAHFDAAIDAALARADGDG